MSIGFKLGSKYTSTNCVFCQLSYRKAWTIVSLYTRLDQIFGDSVVNFLLLRVLIENSVKDEFSRSALARKTDCSACIIDSYTRLTAFATCVCMGTWYERSKMPLVSRILFKFCYDIFSCIHSHTTFSDFQSVLRSEPAKHFDMRHIYSQYQPRLSRSMYFVPAL